MVMEFLPVSLIVKLPSRSVMPPLRVPFSSTLAPMTGSPLESFTLTLTVCAMTLPTNRRKANVSAVRILFSLNDINEVFKLILIFFFFVS